MSGVLKYVELRQRIRLSPKDWDDIETVLGDYELQDEVKGILQKWFDVHLSKLRGEPMTNLVWAKIDAYLHDLACTFISGNLGARIVRNIDQPGFRFLTVEVYGYRKFHVSVLIWLDKTRRSFSAECTVQGVMQ